MKKFLLTAFISVALTACGGGDDDDSEQTSSPSTSISGENTGILTDGVISGVTFTTSSGVTGTTNENGEFTYNDNDQVTFNIGGVQLGETIPAQSRITPLELTSDTNYRESLMVFLQSLDSNSDHDDGIQINEAALKLLENSNININRPASELIQDSEFKQLAAQLGTTIVSPEQAKENFQKALYKDIAGVWEFNRTNEHAVLVYIDEQGNFALGEADETDDAGTAGLETGALNWDALTGNIKPTFTRDTNGEWGLSHPAESKPYTLSFDGTVLSLFEPGVNETYALKRVSKVDGALTGGWKYSEGQIFAFFDNEYYFMIDPVGDSECGQPGIEYGKYLLNSGRIYPETPLFDTNLCAGLYDTTGETPSFAYSINNNLLTVQGEGESAVTLDRINP
ncbi:hypothetical protein [Acinetobacter kanungonis]|uniref:hypothetical protein n=1 Tax=Acinetobacter kanungonis TaxID=2699469 RepID=UPI00137A4D2A|nr:hypothetical protein [Acinetobacter kanungonis]NCI79751.1 hypothetical protein [Acinetobacter kanungonis]